MKTYKGFVIFEILGIAAVLILISFLGYTAYMRYQDNLASNDSTNSKQVGTPNNPNDVTADSAPIINQAADIDSANTMLDSIDLDSTAEDGELETLAGSMN